MLEAETTASTATSRVPSGAYFSIFSSTGRLTCSDSFSFKNPVMKTSDKYALIYDSGNCGLVIYNTFTKVHSQTFDKPICGAAMSQSGFYALITSSEVSSEFLFPMSPSTKASLSQEYATISHPDTLLTLICTMISS